jgi:hypothetical protein
VQHSFVSLLPKSHAANVCGGVRKQHRRSSTGERSALPSYSVLASPLWHQRSGVQSNGFIRVKVCLSWPASPLISCRHHPNQRFPIQRALSIFNVISHTNPATAPCAQDRGARAGAAATEAAWRELRPNKGGETGWLPTACSVQRTCAVGEDG